MQKVLYVITKGNFGGAQKYVLDLATHLPKDRFETSVAFGVPGLLKEKLEQHNIPTYTVHSLQRDVSVWRDFESILELYSLFKRLTPDVVHLNSSKAGGVGALAARMAGVPHIIFTAHGWPFWEDRSTLARGIIWVLSWLTALLSHKVICICKADKEVAERMPFIKGKVALIYNGIDLSTSFGDGKIIREAFPKGVSILGTVGELTKNKNHIALIERAKSEPDLHVAIVGEGELRPFLEEKIREYGIGSRVQLFGFISALHILKGFDRFALPSIKEGLPYILLEAKLAGLPIEAPRIGGIREILDAPNMEQFSLERMVEQTASHYASS